MRNSAILRWTQNNKLLQRNNQNGNTKPPWIHPADAMKTGHIAYLVKFLGRTEVDQPKGIEVVKEGIRKLQFGQEIKKSECSKLPKRELTISINGVAIQEPKSKEILYQYPLHRISYCADDKGEKKFFSFIAKEADKEVHSCFVFVSDKLAEEITLTIGQAFDLAYRQFLDTSGRDLENKKQMMILQKRLALVQSEADELRRRLKAVAELAGPAAVQEYCRKNLILSLLDVSPPTATQNGDHKSLTNGTDSSSSSSSGNSSGSGSPAPPPVPPRNTETTDLIGDFDDNDNAPAVGTKLEGLLFEDLVEPTNGGQNGHSPPPPAISPPPRPTPASETKDLFGAEPFSPPAPTGPPPPLPPPVRDDPFGMGSFQGSPGEIENAIGILDKRISEMEAGFSRGLAIGNDDFSLDDLDPLKN
ncbi:PTB domain-containing engulfment adapter protein 1-like [Pollicipes pollicipes]|uniref:PTB domain-containing engulfment adapter protein 1-like n=1 Tax=Pollicipes pollicipes TaxID=41117 RepID=UPI0018850B7E|nr:PTB domain-containing engulfment adapter protein 1-like [Pollicipes pollicipes]XP_037077296.1 PTB domain-containing engulfment adapter protein 1-like [Pollicipes pollicipes]XP_037077297.1 PTB domain-containing engulfment adapter protein 1-like [Pollicipes pollicipes]XP_037077432.1 PTB domain-containing engulfment adapter protein 1-like [Pollicipes pollicipes]XP_037077433.1 PTB domain-containing engulfment adapter protein 1-like [Pollicipes pollicipes]XP_037077434.1 PTB domain-containing eng